MSAGSTVEADSIAVFHADRARRGGRQVGSRFFERGIEFGDVLVPIVGKKDLERGPYSYGAPDVNVPAMGLDDRLHDRQSEPEPPPSVDSVLDPPLQIGRRCDAGRRP